MGPTVVGGDNNMKDEWDLLKKYLNQRIGWFQDIYEQMGKPIKGLVADACLYSISYYSEVLFEMERLEGL